jgi:flagellar biosynthesis/type III secretory pathway chaperone
MNDSLPELIGIVRMQKEIYDDLLRLARTKNETITRGDIGELDFIVEGEELLIMRLGEIEQARNALIADAAAAHHLDPSNLTISSWPATDPAIRQEALDIQKSFMETLQDIDEINGLNQKLISIHLDYIQHLLDETTVGTKQNAYDNTGNIPLSKSGNPRIVDIIT